MGLLVVISFFSHLGHDKLCIKALGSCFVHLRNVLYWHKETNLALDSKKCHITIKKCIVVGEKI